MCADFVHSVASLSWIDPTTGLPKTDKAPPLQISRDEIVGQKIYRFANFLEVRLTTDDNGQIRNFEFTPDSGMYRGPSEFNFASAPVGKIGRHTEQRGASVVFRQIVGCRTVSPEKAGSAVGAVAGGVGAGFVRRAIVGAVARGVLGAEMGAFGGPWGALGLGIAGVAVGAVVGGNTAGRIFYFPPIWTELELTVNGDGSATHRVISHSLFPSVTVYVRQAHSAYFTSPGVYYDGNPNLRLWNDRGWGPAPDNRSGATAGNPWQMVWSPQLTFEAPAPKPCPNGYECR
jgi:hypothetical protein